jgi:hypothetical protein
MMTMLEKMALRIAAEWQDAPVDMATFSWADVNGWTKDMAFDCARAALEAIREPDETLCDIAADAANEVRPDTYEFYCSREMYGAGHTAMIDAILNEMTG